MPSVLDCYPFRALMGVVAGCFLGVVCFTNRTAGPANCAFRFEVLGGHQPRRDGSEGMMERFRGRGCDAFERNEQRG